MSGFLRDVVEKEISSIQFGVFSNEEIENMSVASITKPKLSTDHGCVYDIRLGSLDNNVICETCGNYPKDCPGHYGHIELNKCILHPLHYKNITSLISCICIKCYRLILSNEQLEIKGILKSKGKNRLAKIVKNVKKCDECSHCGNPVPEFKFSTNEKSIYMVYKEGGEKISVVLSVDEIKHTFERIIDEDIESMGFDKSLMHPKNLIMKNFIVIPPAARPYVISEGNICDDDLTNQIIEIVKINNALGKEKIPNNKVQKLIQSLKFRISTFYNNSNDKAKHSTNGRPIKCLKKRMTGKSGQMRDHIMGKRCLGPDTPVSLWNGSFKKAKDIVVGDLLIGDDGKKRTVKNTTSGVDTMYKIIQNKGIDYEVNSEHILSLKFSGHKTIIWNKKDCKYSMRYFDKSSMKIKTKTFNTKTRGKVKAYQEMIKFSQTIVDDNIVDIPIKNYLKLPISTKNRLLGFKLGNSINWDYKEVKLDPYILGMWLGDGTSRGYSFTTIDKELVEYYEKWAKENNCKITKWNETGKFHYGIVKNDTTKNSFMESLRYYNLVNNKHIPEDYIYNDENTRLRLLAGIIDTDGSVEQKGRIVRITQCDKNISILEGVKKIASSLGLSVSKIKNKKTKCNGKEFNANVITISGRNLHKIPTILKHKSCVSSCKDTNNYKIKIETIGEGNFNGFEVDGNNRFLLGDYTVTHNCEKTGRTVIGPDPTLKINQLAVPYEIANNLTIPETVTKFNIERLTKTVNSDRAKHLIRKNRKINLKYATKERGTMLEIGDIIHRNDNKYEVKFFNTELKEGDIIERKGEFLEDVKYPCRKIVDLRIGDIVERKLKNGDIVLLNRQPTLHNASMQAMEIVIMKHKTFRFNLSIAKPFNADFNTSESNREH